MTELNLEKAKQNRNERASALAEYNKINEAIKVFSDDGFGFVAKIRTWERGDWREIHLDPKEFHNLLLNTRDRYDAEISRLDEEFDWPTPHMKEYLK